MQSYLAFFPWSIFSPPNLLLCPQVIDLCGCRCLHSFILFDVSLSLALCGSSSFGQKNKMTPCNKVAFHHWLFMSKGDESDFIPHLTASNGLCFLFLFIFSPLAHLLLPCYFGCKKESATRPGLEHLSNCSFWITGKRWTRNLAKSKQKTSVRQLQRR